MKFWQVDAFSTEAFKGNPAGVIILKKDIENKLKQKIAMELNLSETAFVLLGKDKNEIKWFTPNSEVALCGHATIGAAHILWSNHFISLKEISFESLSGKISVTKEDNNLYTLNFPAQKAIPKPEYKKLINEIISVNPLFIGSNTHDCAVVIEDEEYVKNYNPNLEKISKLNERGFLLASRSSNSDFDYIYRGFFPKLNVAEDPVTGSANTILLPYFAEVLGKSKLKAYQASKRGGELILENKNDRVLISGNAFTTVVGELIY